jgi:hypothetical protein
LEVVVVRGERFGGARGKCRPFGAQHVLRGVYPGPHGPGYLCGGPLGLGAVWVGGRRGWVGLRGGKVWGGVPLGGRMFVRRDGGGRENAWRLER